MPVKVLGADGTGTMSNLAAGITWATDHGAKVISMSLGGSASSTLASAVTYAHNKGAVLVASAGNYGNTSKVYPAAYPEVLGVAGTDSTDQLYSWSTYGSWVALAAPGCNYTTGRNGWYGTFCGTSSAAPALAGIAGLAASLVPSASNSAIEQALKSTAVNVGSVVAYGRVDGYATLQALAGGSSPSPSPTPTASPSPSPTPTDSPSPSPSPTETASPSPSPTETASPSPSPTAPTPTVTTATFSGTLSKARATRVFAVTTGGGQVTAVVTFTKTPSLALDVVQPDGGKAGSAQGGAPVTITVRVEPGTSQVVVSGSTRASFTLTVTYPST
jgi:subtilisin family serine protease